MGSDRQTIVTVTVQVGPARRDLAGPGPAAAAAAAACGQPGRRQRNHPHKHASSQVQTFKVPKVSSAWQSLSLGVAGRLSSLTGRRRIYCFSFNLPSLLDLPQCSEQLDSVKPPGPASEHWHTTSTTSTQASLSLRLNSESFAGGAVRVTVTANFNLNSVSRLTRSR